MHRYVDCRSIKCHTRLRTHRPRRALERLALNECGDGGRLRPGGIAQVSIENDGDSAFVDRDGGHLRDRPLRKGRRPHAHHRHYDDCEYEPSGHASPQQHKTHLNDAWLTGGLKKPGSGPTLQPFAPSPGQLSHAQPVPTWKRRSVLGLRSAELAIPAGQDAGRHRGQTRLIAAQLRPQSTVG